MTTRHIAVVVRVGSILCWRGPMLFMAIFHASHVMDVTDSG